MKQRINVLEKSPRALKSFFSFNQYLQKSPLPASLLELVYLRVSQINGCAFCLDMHSKDLRAGGETEQRIYMISAWREVPFYTSREKAALAWAEAVTLLTDNQVSDEVYEAAIQEFSDEELIDLTLAVSLINSANRLNISFRNPAGDYVPGQFATVAQ